MLALTTTQLLICTIQLLKGKLWVKLVKFQLRLDQVSLLVFGWVSLSLGQFQVRLVSQCKVSLSMGQFQVRIGQFKYRLVLGQVNFRISQFLFRFSYQKRDVSFRQGQVSFNQQRLTRYLYHYFFLQEREREVLIGQVRIGQVRKMLVLGQVQ